MFFNAHNRAPVASGIRPGHGQQDRQATSAERCHSLVAVRLRSARNAIIRSPGAPSLPAPRPANRQPTIAAKAGIAREARTTGRQPGRLRTRAMRNHRSRVVAQE